MNNMEKTDLIEQLSGPAHHHNDHHLKHHGKDISMYNLFKLHLLSKPGSAISWLWLVGGPCNSCHQWGEGKFVKHECDFSYICSDVIFVKFASMWFCFDRLATCWPASSEKERSVSDIHLKEENCKNCRKGWEEGVRMEERRERSWKRGREIEGSRKWRRRPWREAFSTFETGTRIYFNLVVRNENKNFPGKKIPEIWLNGQKSMASPYMRRSKGEEKKRWRGGGRKRGRERWKILIDYRQWNRTNKQTKTELLSSEMKGLSPSVRLRVILKVGKP